MWILFLVVVNIYDPITECLTLNRYTVEEISMKWSWESAWEIFRDNLIPLK